MLTRREITRFGALSVFAAITGCNKDDNSSLKVTSAGVSLESLRLANADAIDRIPAPESVDKGLGSVGLIMDAKSIQHRYSCTPLNCVTFACTGGNGVHFSLIAKNGIFSQNSPVVITNPAALGNENYIVGENLFDFLCLGYHRGYYALEQLGYKLELTLEVFCNPDWQPSEKGHRSAGYILDNHERKIMRFLSDRFSLRPWSSKDRFALLQKEYGSKLELQNP